MTSENIYPPLLAPLYWILRVYVWGLGAFFMVIVFLSPFLSSGGGPSSIEEFSRIAISILAGISFLLPNRLGVSDAISYIRIAIMLAAGVSMLDMGSQLASGVYGPKPHLTFSTVFGPIEYGVFTAPILLAWRRYSMRKLNTTNETPDATAA